MSNKHSTESAKKITVTIPAELLSRLDKHVADRQRSQFIAEAIEVQLALEEQVEALEEAAGAWTDENHPELLTGRHIDAWLKNLRQSWRVPERAPHE